MAVKWLGPSPSCSNPTKHQAEPGMVGVVGEIDTHRPNQHTCWIEPAFGGEGGWARPDELKPLDEWGMFEEKRAVAGMGVEPPATAMGGWVGELVRPLPAFRLGLTLADEPQH